MKNQEITELQNLSLTELVRRALKLDIQIESISTRDISGRRLLLTPDGVRLKIIDRTVEREMLDEQPTKELSR